MEWGLYSMTDPIKTGHTDQILSRVAWIEAYVSVSDCNTNLKDYTTRNRTVRWQQDLLMDIISRFPS